MPWQNIHLLKIARSAWVNAVWQNKISCECRNMLAHKTENFVVHVRLKKFIDDTINSEEYSKFGFFLLFL